MLNVYLFNPTCEYAVANGNRNWQPNYLLRKMEEDLCTLPFIMANENDIVLIKHSPKKNFIKKIGQTGISLPGFERIEDILKNTERTLPKINKLLPWGWSPAAHHYLSPLKQACSKEFLNSPVADWKPDTRAYYSKKFAVKILKQVLNEHNSEAVLPQNLLPEICTSQEDFERLLLRWRKIMVKAPWSSSGRGLQPVTKTPVHPKVWEKLLGIVKEQGYAICEPFLNKVLDMAFQFEIIKGKVSFLGTSFFETDRKGQYKHNFINGLPENIDSEIIDFVMDIKPKLIHSLKKHIENSELAELYEGFLGVDALIYFNEKKQLRINPCLEINVRQNMGLLSLKLEKYLLPGKKGIFSVNYRPDQTYSEFKKEMEKNHPLRFKGNKIESGFLLLTPVFNNTLFGAYLLV